MEIEAKFGVEDGAVRKTLARIEAIGDYTLGAPTTLTMRDTFFDTRTEELLASRHVLRVRKRSDGRLLMTFKAPSTRSAGIHKRPETEVWLDWSRTPRRLFVKELPARIRKMVMPLLAREESKAREVKERELVPLFSISQKREICTVKQGRRMVAEWSLDHVTFRAGMEKKDLYELEIELKGKGTETDLDKMVQQLTAEFQLPAQNESKFKRGLDFVRGFKTD